MSPHPNTNAHIYTAPKVIKIILLKRNEFKKEEEKRRNEEEEMRMGADVIEQRV